MTSNGHWYHRQDRRKQPKPPNRKQPPKPPNVARLDFTVAKHNDIVSQGLTEGVANDPGITS